MASLLYRFNTRRLFLSGHINRMVYNTPVTTIEDLKTRIRRTCRRIRSDVLRKVWDDTKSCLNVLQNVQGGLIEILVAQINIDVFSFPSICYMC